MAMLFKFESQVLDEIFCYICSKFAKANLLIAMTLVPIVRHGVFSFR